MKEIFKDVNGYEGIYKISNMGKIRKYKAMNSMTYNYDDAERQSDELSEEIKDKLNDFERLDEDEVMEVYLCNFGVPADTLEQAEEEIREAIENDDNMIL